MKACFVLVFFAFLHFQNNAKAVPMGSAAEGVDNVKALDDAPHVLVKRSEIGGRGFQGCLRTPVSKCGKKRACRVKHGRCRIKSECRFHAYGNGGRGDGPW